MVSSIVAVALDGFSPPKALAIIGEPSKASIALNRTFCDAQPIVLKASVTPTAVFPEPPLPPLPPAPAEDDAVAALVVMAMSLAVFAAATVTPTPVPVPVVVTALLLSVAVAELWTRFVPIRASMARGDVVVEPAVVVGVAEEPALTSLVVVTVSVAISLACTSTLPPVVETVALVIEAAAPPRTSLSDTAPATPVRLPLLLPPGAVVELPNVIVALIDELSLPSPPRRRRPEWWRPGGCRYQS